MMQLAFAFPRAIEIPFARWSWVEHGQVVVVEIGAHCPLEHLAYWHPWSIRP